MYPYVPPAARRILNRTKTRPGSVKYSDMCLAITPLHWANATAQQSAHAGTVLKLDDPILVPRLAAVKHEAVQVSDQSVSETPLEKLRANVSRARAVKEGKPADGLRDH
jgi:hypothetical protein